ncbi:hypothetical protein HBA55_31455 [Pseudomaricurvus alkylphenolicus]|nr:hypothetical protein [Pseudomaricurvus alkylphenolicus]
MKKGSAKSEKTSKKAVKKDSQLIIRINKEQRDTFVRLCDEMDTSAAREIRLFIREFLKQHDHS